MQFEFWNKNPFASDATGVHSANVIVTNVKWKLHTAFPLDTQHVYSKTDLGILEKCEIGIPKPQSTICIKVEHP